MAAEQTPELMTPETISNIVVAFSTVAGAAVGAFATAFVTLRNSRMQLKAERERRRLDWVLDRRSDRDAVLRERLTEFVSVAYDVRMAGFQDPPDVDEMYKVEAAIHALMAVSPQSIHSELRDAFERLPVPVESVIKAVQSVMYGEDPPDLTDG